MKRGLSILIIFFLIALFFQVIINFFITKHSITYSVNDNKYAYDIEEDFSIIDKVHMYNFVITDSSKNVYTFNYINDLNKQKHVIQSIKTYTNNGLVCIVPMFKRNAFGNIYCSKEGNVLSYTSLVNDNDFKTILDNIKKDNYFKDNYKLSDNSNKLEKTVYYKDNIPSNYRFVLWDYYGIDIFDNKESKSIELLQNTDDYNNTYSRIVGKYYVALSRKSGGEIHYYNLKEDGEKYVPVEDNLSTDYLVMGVFDNKLYFLDNESFKQYCIDPYKSTMSEVGNEANGYVFVKNNSLDKVEASLFKTKVKEYVFDKPITNNKINKKYGDVDIFISNNTYYFKTKDNTFYKSSTKYPDKATLLFKENNISTWKVVDDTIIFVKGNSLYFYDDIYGLKKVLSNNELNYNYNNICDLYIIK